MSSIQLNVDDVASKAVEFLKDSISLANAVDPIGGLTVDDLEPEAFVSILNDCVKIIRASEKKRFVYVNTTI